MFPRSLAEGSDGPRGEAWPPTEETWKAQLERLGNSFPRAARSIASGRPPGDVRPCSMLAQRPAGSPCPAAMPKARAASWRATA